MGDDYYFPIPDGFHKNQAHFKQNKVNPKKSLQVAPGWDNQIFGVNEKNFKNKNVARIAESVVTGLTGAPNPKGVVSAVKNIKAVASLAKETVPYMHLPNVRKMLKTALLPKNNISKTEYIAFLS